MNEAENHLAVEEADAAVPPESAAVERKRTTVQISVVVPLCNEAENVKPLAERVLSSLAPLKTGIELLLVDDGSTDSTWDLVADLHKRDPRIRALRHKRRSGQSAALWSGLNLARGEILCTLDGDLQNDPADLPQMIQMLKEADLVCGDRINRQDTAFRRISSRVARWARKAVLGVDFHDTGCNLRVMRRSVLQKVFPFNGLHRFMPVLAHISGATVREIPVRHHPRIAGQTKYGLWNRLGRGIWDLSVMAWYRKRQINTVQVLELDAAKPGAEHQDGASPLLGR